MNNVSQILSATENGKPHAAEQLLPLVYDEQRKLTAQRLQQEKPVQTLRATAQVHEAYLRLVDVDQAQGWNSRSHFFAAAAEAMRRILLNQARDKERQKRVSSQALDWLQYDLQRLTMQAKNNPEAIAQQLRNWQRDPGLADVREARQLSKLPRTEQENWCRVGAAVSEATGGSQSGK